MLRRSITLGLAILSSLTAGTIFENGRPRVTDYPKTAVEESDYSFQTYAADAPELSYKGRWDSKHCSWWSAPGIVFGYTGQTVAITFGNLTDAGVLVGYRISGLDWQFANVTGGATHLLVNPDTPGSNLTSPISPSTFEFRVSNWGRGVQISKVHVAAGEKLIKIPDFDRRLEVIGDSLSAGYSGTYEGLSSFGYGLGAGLGNTEYSITAYPGICVADQDCWGNPRGQVHQWFYTSDTRYQATQIWGDNPEPWDFSKHPEADIVVINIGTNDQNEANNVTAEAYVEAYTKLVQGVHGKYPKAQVVLMSLWLGFYQSGNSFFSSASEGFEKEIYSIYEYFNSDEYLNNPIIYDGVTNKTTKLDEKSEPFVHYFNTTGIMQHNDIAPQYHPTDVGYIKVASHLIQYIRMKFDWVLYATGPEVQHDTLYWNNDVDY